MAGCEGSGKMQLGQHLTKYSKDDQNWAVIKQAVHNVQPFDANVLQLTLAHTWQAVKKRRRQQKQHSDGPKHVRALIVTPGFVTMEIWVIFSRYRILFSLFAAALTR